MHYDPEFLRHLLEYVIHADRVAFEAAGALAEEAYYAPRGFSFGSIHNLLVHQMVAQQTWLNRWLGRPQVGRLDNETEYPTRALLAERWPGVHHALRDYLARQTDESLNALMTVRRNNGEQITLPLGAMVMHVIDHGTYHRGQLATMLKLAGAPSVAYAPYFRFAAGPNDG